MRNVCSTTSTVLGGENQVPTLGGTVELKIPAATTAARRFRLARRGLPGPDGEHGDLYAVVRIEVPKTVDAEERRLSSSWPRIPASIRAVGTRQGAYTCVSVIAEDPVWLNESALCSLEELAELSGLSQDELAMLVENGVLRPAPENRRRPRLLRQLRRAGAHRASPARRFRAGCGRLGGGGQSAGPHPRTGARAAGIERPASVMAAFSRRAATACAVQSPIGAIDSA